MSILHLLTNKCSVGVHIGDKKSIKFKIKNSSEVEAHITFDMDNLTEFTLHEATVKVDPHSSSENELIFKPTLVRWRSV